MASPMNSSRMRKYVEANLIEAEAVNIRRGYSVLGVIYDELTAITPWQRKVLDRVVESFDGR